MWLGQELKEGVLVVLIGYAFKALYKMGVCNQNLLNGEQKF